MARRLPRRGACILLDASVIGADASGRLLSAMDFFCLEAALVIGFLARVLISFRAVAWSLGRLDRRTRCNQENVQAIDALKLLWRGLGGHSITAGEDNGLVQATVAAAGVVRLLATVVGMDDDGI